MRYDAECARLESDWLGGGFFVRIYEVELSGAVHELVRGEDEAIEYLREICDERGFKWDEVLW